MNPDKFWAFSKELFAKQTEYFDTNVVNETRNATYKRLAKLAGTVDGLDGEKVLKLLEVSDKPGEDGSMNTGNGVTDDIKMMVKVWEECFAFGGRGYDADTTSADESIAGGTCDADGTLQCKCRREFSITNRMLMACRAGLKVAFRAVSRKTTGTSGLRRTLRD